MTTRTLALMLMLLLAAPLQAATVYRWTDAQGRVHFSDERPAGVADVQTLRLPGTAAPVPSPPPANRAAPLADRRQVSERVRQIRCRDFRGALVQLQQLDDVAADDRQWLAAKQQARQAVTTWCE